MKKTTFLLSMLMICFAFSTYAQTIIKGVVQDANLAPIPFATVVVKNTSIGTLTDIDGKFELKVNPLPVKVISSFVGFQSQEITINSNELLTIIMIEGIGLDEVMVTSTKVIRSQKLSAMSMTSMKGKDIQFKAASGQADILASIPGITAEGVGG